MGRPDRIPSNSTQHYIPGPISSVSKDLIRDIHGASNVGKDGVLRSFASNGTVIDYRQLDPEQVKEFAIKQLAAWKVTGDIPESIVKFAEPPYPDGRLVTSENDLLNPAKKPKFDTHGEEKDFTPAPRYEVVGELEARQLIQPECVGATCQSLANCQAHNPPCHACYYEHGPPNGRCFLN